MDIPEAVEQLENLLVLMDTMLYKYYHDDIKKVENQRIKLFDKDYNFYDIKKFLLSQSLDYPKLRKICELEYKIYNVLIAPFISMPTARTNVKKKLLEKLYSFIPKSDKWFTDFIDGYNSTLKLLKAPDNFFNFRCYAESQMYKSDLDCTIMKVGSGRIGKSIHTLQELRRVVSFKYKYNLKRADSWLVAEGIIPNHVIYDDISVFNEKVGSIRESFFIFDDAIWIGDKRKAMYGELLQITEKITTYGSLDNMYWANIQNLSDIDGRITNKSNIIDLLTERGVSYTYCSPKNVAIIKDSFGFEIFQKKPFLLRGSKVQVDHNLKRIPSFIKKAFTRDMSKDVNSIYYNPIYGVYKDNKDKWLARSDSMDLTGRSPTEIALIKAGGL